MDAKSKAEAKGLRIWNGRGHCGWWHLYVCAKSMADANRLLQKIEGCEHMSFLNELRVYCSPNCWGNPMEGIEPERGVWGQRNRNDKPEKIV
jgi:hypothetical protein